jgi:DNA polymerase III epsilon subunit family exonuclease
MLVNQCSLVDSLIEMLDRQRGTADYRQVGEDLFYISTPDTGLIKQLLQGLLDQDKRFVLGETCVEMPRSRIESGLLKDTTYVVVDVETTGATPGRDRITEIAAYKISGGHIVDEFSTLVNPERPITPYIVNLTGITDEMVANAPVFSTICEKVVDFFGDAVFVAHNAPFDWRFINREIERVTNRNLANMRLCTVQMARRIVPGLVNYKLHTVADHFSIEIVDRHRAGGDAFATAKVFIKFLDLMTDYGVPNVAGARRFRIAGSHSRY